MCIRDSPTTLPCLDSLCATCFKEVCDTHSDSSTGVAICPHCGDPFHLPSSHPQTLPDRGFIDTLVALRKISSQNLVDDNCEICKRVLRDSETVAAAEYYCIECRQRMCTICANRHPGCSFTKNHNIVGLGFDSANKMLNAIKNFIPRCASHKERDAVVHCYECSIGLCSQCQNIHPSHDVEVLTDQTYSQLTHKVKTLSEQMRQVLYACKEKTGQVEKLLVDRKTGISLAEKQISDKADELISLIQRQRDDLLNRLHSGNDQIIASLETVSSSLSHTFLADKRAARFVKELLGKGSLEDMLLNYDMLKSRVTKLHDTSADVSVADDSDCNDVSAAALIHNICTSLDSQSKSFSQCVIVDNPIKRLSFLQPVPLTEFIPLQSIKKFI